ncbi:hypothetical protein DFQ28_008087 [Apophysomyces sp. BC1034]|nr:hypothetical protein DFQ30_007764 [Apophysomyces sp. BC1015]KAG0176609.1 hypothetical protein DFQ29_005893 [Apophysomyces sp. BC1021]KAG0186262.1 hypothetical protein DFQ28_008087 [Apophysomyces sp. BC1034]
MDPPSYDYSSEKRLYRSQTIAAAGSSGLFVSLFLPVLNIVFTCVLIGVIVYIYVVSNDQPDDFTLAGLRIPTLLAIITTLTTIALSEYKWVKLQRQQGKLSMLEMYDACTRGIGGVIRVLHGLRVDTVLAIAVVFHLGLIAIGPAAQQILGSGIQVVCDSSHNRLSFNNITSKTDLSTFTNKAYTNDYDPRSNQGLQQDYILRLAFAQAATNLTGTPNFWCGDTSINCTFPDIPVFSIRADCQRGSLQTKIVDIYKHNVTTVSSYFNLDSTNAIFKSPIMPDTPQFMYGASMFNRTIYDLRNYTKPFYETKKNMTEVRQSIGPQTFVALTANGTMHNADQMSDLQVYECTLQTSMNTTTFVYRDNSLQILSSTSKPYPLDFDLLSNTTYWSQVAYSGPMTMQSAYGYQIEIMNALVGDGYDAVSDLIKKWSMYNLGYNATLPDLFSSLFFNADLSVVLALPIDSFMGGLAMGSNRNGTRCYNTLPMYHFNPAQFYPLALCLVIPLLWWAAIWIMSMYYTNGVSRGNSQMALMVTGFSPAVRDHFKGLSHAGQAELLQQANKIDVRFGETQHMSSSLVGHVSFGVPAEITVLPTRRRMSL